MSLQEGRTDVKEPLWGKIRVVAAEQGIAIRCHLLAIDKVKRSDQVHEAVVAKENEQSPVNAHRRLDRLPLKLDLSDERDEDFARNGGDYHD